MKLDVTYLGHNVILGEVVHFVAKWCRWQSSINTSWLTEVRSWILWFVLCISCLQMKIDGTSVLSVIMIEVKKRDQAKGVSLVVLGWYVWFYTSLITES